MSAAAAAMMEVLDGTPKQKAETVSKTFKDAIASPALIKHLIAADESFADELADSSGDESVFGPSVRGSLHRQPHSAAKTHRRFDWNPEAIATANIFHVYGDEARNRGRCAAVELTPVVGPNFIGDLDILGDFSPQSPTADNLTKTASPSNSLAKEAVQTSLDQVRTSFRMLIRILTTLLRALVVLVFAFTSAKLSTERVPNGLSKQKGHFPPILERDETQEQRKAQTTSSTSLSSGTETMLLAKTSAKIAEGDKDVLQINSLPQITDGEISKAIVSPEKGYSTYELALREAWRCHRAVVLKFDGIWQDWGLPADIPFFDGWEPLKAYELPRNLNLAQDVADANQKRWDDSHLNISVFGSGGEVGGFFGIVKHWLSPTDWLSLYRAQPRIVWAADNSRLGLKPVDTDELRALDHDLFDTTKYFGSSSFLSVFTYGKGNYGKAHLFKIQSDDNERSTGSQAISLKQVACSAQIPKVILRSLDGGCRVEMRQKQGKVRFTMTGDKEMPYTARLVACPSKQMTAFGHRWRSALGISASEGYDDGLVASIPQMLGLLHLKGTSLRKLHSSKALQFEKPLLPLSMARLQVITRGVMIESGPVRDGHDGDSVKVVVLYPSDSKWAKERFLWG